jgi:hypothetical protein
VPAEIPEWGTGFHIPEAEVLEVFLLGSLVQYDGLCLDNEPERIRLAPVLAAAFLSAGGEGVNQPVPPLGIVLSDSPPLPLLTLMVDTVLENTEEQHQAFMSIKDRPHVLDDGIVNRAIRLYQAQIDDVWF